MLLLSQGLGVGVFFATSSTHPGKNSGHKYGCEGGSIREKKLLKHREPRIKLLDEGILVPRAKFELDCSEILFGKGSHPENVKAKLFDGAVVQI